MASIMAAPPLVSPVRLKATSENAMGPAACGTPKVPDEMNQRSSRHRFVAPGRLVKCSRPASGQDQYAILGDNATAFDDELAPPQT
jgi:hypothetical protein